MTLPLPPFDPGDPAGLQFILDRLADAAIDTGGQAVKLRFGTSSVTFTASANSAQVTIPHGMGSKPVIAGGFAATPANARITVQESATADPTNIYLTGFQTQGTAVSITQNIYWFAIG